jgi:hypothetical protein
MIRIRYLDVVRRAEGLFLGTRDDVSTVDDRVINTHFNVWAQQLWEEFFWPEWTVAQQRQFRPSWDSATSYGAPSATAAVERYHVRSGKYFQSLVAGNLGNAPADANGVENSAFWAECQAAYSGDDWASGRTYSATSGSPAIVRNPDDDRFYQCHTAHTAGAAFDSTKFGILTPFRRSLDYDQSGETPIGAVAGIFDRDPNVYFGDATEIDFRLGNKIYVAGDEGRVWVELRKRPPSWTGDDWAAATTYAVDDQVYGVAQGDFYKSLQAANVGNAVTDTAWWERIDVPHVFRDAVAQAIVAELLDTDEKPDAAAVARRKAARLAEQEFEKISRQQKQARQLPMRR